MKVPMFSTADICDIHKNVYVVKPLLRNFGGRVIFCGRIVTIHVDNDNSKVRELLERKGEDQVLIVDNGGSTQCALIGGNLARLAYENGWRGVLINGCVRDIDELASVPIGIRAIAALPRRSEKRQTGQVNVVVTFAGVSFMPGHFLYADSDGIVVSQQAI